MRLIIVAALALGWLTTLPATAEEPFIVIVHESNPTAALSRSELSRLFLKRTTRWKGSLKIHPVDLPSSSLLRQTFSKTVHGKDVSWVEAYWRKMIFAGRSSQPPELDSEDRALEFVRDNPGAIAYVSRSTTLGKGVRPLQIDD